MVLIGAGGYAKEVYDVLQVLKLTSSVCFFDDVNTEKKEIFGLNILHNVDEIPKEDSLILSVGTPRTRKILFNKLEKVSLSKNFVNLISPNSNISSIEVSLGLAVNIMHFVVISPSVKIGNGTLINSRVLVAHDVTIGDFCDICPNVSLSGGCQIGDEVFIGTGAIILPNVKIGAGAKIGAGVVVTKNVKSGVTIMEVPRQVTLQPEKFS